MRVTPLTSGSCGNATLVESTGAKVLVDAGVSQRYLSVALARLGCSVTDIDAILLTHEHTDHLGTAVALSRRHGIPLWVDLALAETMGELAEAHLRVIPVGDYFGVQDMEVHSFRTHHDSLAPLGFAVYHGKHKVAIATDTGMVTDDVMAALSCADVCLIEANHDSDMLRESRYPRFLKARIAGPRGHLSNDAMAEILRVLVSGRPQTFLLSHLSAECNTPALALAAAERVIKECRGSAARVMCAPRSEVGPTITL